MASTEPFLRWAGGKRWLAKALGPILSTRVVGGTYFEPFLGSGAMFFALQPRKAILSDLNKELMTTFKEVTQHPEILAERLSALPTTRRRYEDIRKWRPRSAQDRAVRFIYLNRNCYGGLYRENRQGMFNVPFGGGERNHRRICRDGTLLHASMLLNRPDIEIFSCDFEQTMARAGDGDVVYCDPTYRQVTRQHFDRYGKIIFG
ncbi:MAG TPA: DNA adenine methylase [Candidatus Binatia bacterium]|nr:DNA adenine methylase [Candidatus Binatia bacterium]